MCRLLPPTGFSLWFGECSPLSVSSECEREREDGILFFHYRGGEQIIKSMKRKVTLSREGSTHSPLSFPVTAHPSQVPHLNFKLERLRLLYVACKYHIEGYITKD